MSEATLVSVAIEEWKEAGQSQPPMTDRLAKVTLEALKRAKLSMRDIDVVIATTSAIPFDNKEFITISAMHYANRVTEKLGSYGCQIINVSGACASAAQAFAIANAMIKSGVAKTALIIGVDNSPRGFYYQGPSILDADLAVGYPHKVIGITNPAYWAIWAVRRAYEDGISIDEMKELMALVKHYSSIYGALNPYARYKKVFTPEDVLKSPVVCDPLHLYMICAVSTGAGAAVVTEAEKAKMLTNKPIRVLASKLGCPQYNEPAPRLVYFSTAGGSRASKPFTEWRQAVKSALKEAAVTPDEIDILEVHDTSVFHTINWIDQIMGWEYSETDKLIKKGEIKHNGILPTNLSGGTASFGEAVQCQAFMELHELWLQLRGEAGPRQAKKKLRIGVATAYGLSLIHI